jgi:FtsP/CotA-like multicopper oxidase with cupredoxin domain
MSNATQSAKDITRRGFIRQGGIAAMLAAGAGSYLRLAPEAFANAGPATPFKFTPFTRPLPIPNRLAPAILNPIPGSVDAVVGSPAVYHGIAPEYDPTHSFNKDSWVLNDPKTGKRFTEKHHVLEYKKTVQELIPGVKTNLYGFNGTVPGPTIRARLGEPMVVRVKNSLVDTEASLHLHGAHSPSHADGHPCFYVFPNQQRDYFYPNVAPKVHGKMDVSEVPSTMWYHDHGNDVTAFNVAHGLAGFCFMTDELEENLIKNLYLPDVDLRDAAGNLLLAADGSTQQGRYDIPMALTDQRLNADGSLWWDPFDHDGRIGDVFTVNGVAQPFLNVEPRKYRFRILCASLARVYQLRLSNGQTMSQIGNDSWLLPKAIETASLYLNPARRADVIIDFSKLAGKTIYLENIMRQTSGRKADGVDPKRPTKMVKFIVGTTKDARFPDFNVPTGVIRPHENITAAEATVTRHFDLNRSNGAWQINGEFYNAFRCDAQIRKGAVEKWVLRNGSGGWWHPIHIHVESHQVVSINGKAPPEFLKYKSDHTQLEDNQTVEILMKFRTFDGPFVFHCHNNNHEDMRMMKQIEICNVQADGTTSPPYLNGQWFSVPEKICGVPTEYVKNHPGLFS